ncbi:MAG TPA: sulfotransferase [Candidatus Baltobacteraceae bacterium]|nr:sulfotransferase [Candidatus Baltobacteraceae bacterium]
MTPSFQDAVALHAQGKFDEAAAAYREVLESGKHFGAAYNLSLLYASQGHYDEALPQALEAVELDPTSAEANDHAGGILVNLGRHEPALPYFEAALRISPQFVRAYNNLGAALTALGRSQEAIGWLERAVTLQPDYADAHLNLATALEQVDRYDEAQEHLRHAVAIEPERPQAYAKIGAIAGMQGDMDRAVEALRRGLQREGQSGRLYHLLTSTSRLTLDDPAVTGMQALLENADALHLEEHIALHFALGNVYTDNGRLDLSLEHFTRGNALKRRLVDYDERATLGHMEALAATFPADAIRKLEGAGYETDKHVFIVGMPRSGTTLAEQILASHPHVYGAGELNAFHDAAVVTFAHDTALTPFVLQKLGRRYSDGVAALAPNASRVTDKMPANFKYAGLIHLALPNARIVHMRRDPVDTCVSCFSQNFSGEQPFAYDLAELGRYYRGYEKLMDHWRNAMPPAAMLEIQYEELIGDFEAHARRLIDYVGLPWDPACLDFHRTQRSVRTASVAQVRRPIYTSSIGRWKSHEQRLKPLLEALGIGTGSTS